MKEEANSIFENMLVSSDKFSETELLEIITNRVVELMQQDLGLLMSYLYRLDIEESDINRALIPDNQSESPHQAIAKLILERQLQRAAVKKAYKVEPIDDWED
jgi:hypothetical protein